VAPGEARNFVLLEAAISESRHSSGLYGSRAPTNRERDVIRLVAGGLTNKEVAESIGTTEHVIKNYLRAIYDKIGVWNRLELAMWYVRRRADLSTDLARTET
jgi:DNA-binding NarL/FixJ family response regulator